MVNLTGDTRVPSAFFVILVTHQPGSLLKTKSFFYIFQSKKNIGLKGEIRASPRFRE